MEGVRGLTNINIKSKFKQICVLLAVILACMAISQTMQAQSYHHSKSKHFKEKYKKLIKQNDKVCSILEKKRTQTSKQPLFAFLKPKPKYKPQAEVEAPSYVRINNRQEVTASASKR